MTNTIKLPQLAWYDTSELELPIPDGWQVETCNMAGYDLPAMTDDQIRNALNNLIGLPPIRELAKGKKEVVIISDDLARITRTSRLVPFVLEELAKAGIPDSSIRFIVAVGNHGAMDREDLAKKLGEDIVSRFLVYNHNPHDYCTYVGTTSSGTKVYVNTEFMSCDFKISIGSLTPHLFVIFGGGSKMILPGVSHIDTIEYNHKLGTDPALKAKYETHPVHLDMDEAASFVGLDVNIEGFVNLWGDTTTLFAGEPKQAHTAGIEAAKSHYLTPRAKDKDIVIANAYMKASESATAAAMCLPMVKPGGDLVLVNNTPSGQVVHYMGGPWGKAIQPRKPVLMPIPPNVNRLIIYNEYPELVGLQYYDRQDKVMMLSNWDDILQALKEVHGDKPAVAVYPTADISYFS